MRVFSRVRLYLHGQFTFPDKLYQRRVAKKCFETCLFETLDHPPKVTRGVLPEIGTCHPRTSGNYPLSHQLTQARLDAQFGASAKEHARFLGKPVPN